jgi:hypothetical protein
VVYRFRGKRKWRDEVFCLVFDEFGERGEVLDKLILSTGRVLELFSKVQYHGSTEL